MEEVDFFAQSRAVQDRFLGATSGRAEAEPAPLAYMPAPDRQRVALIAAAGAASALAVGLAAVGFGKLDSRFALAPSWMAGVEALALGVAGALLSLAAARARRRQALPFRTGVFLFPAAVIVARGARLEVYGFDQLASASAVGSSLQLVFAGQQTFTIPAADADTARRAAEQVLANRDAVLHADERALARLHPLKETGIVSPLASTTPLVAPPAAGGVVATVGAAIVGAALGVGLWYARNLRSEAVLFRVAQRENSIAAYQQYLARGGKRVEVVNVLLPRAELARARQAGTVEAIEAFMRAHEGSPVLGEARAALKAVLARQIDDLAKAGSAGKLRGLETDRHADLMRAELGRAIAAVYQREIARYAQRAVGARADGKRCVDALLRYASEHGPDVDVVTLQVPGSSLESADLAVKHSPYFPGSAAVPSQYFDDAHARERAQALARSLVASLQPAFNPEILAFHAGAPLPPEQADKLDPPARPTLVIEHKTVLSGTFANASPPLVLVGVALTFTTLCALPSAEPVQVVKQASWNPPTADTLKSGDPPGKIYEATVDKQVEAFTSRLLAALGLSPR